MITAVIQSSSATTVLAVGFVNSRMMTNFSNPVLGIIAGAVFTAVIQSSSAAVGILQALETAMNRHPQQTYMVILGFILAGMVQAFPGLPEGWEWPLCAALAAAGFWAIYKLSLKEK